MFGFGAKQRLRRHIQHIHGQIVAATRLPVFYLEFGVPDTFEGRFELLSLHATLVLRRLQQLQAPAMAQALADQIFIGLDDAMRQMGVSDAVVPKRIGRMLEAFTGRMLAYGQALERQDDSLALALQRNVQAGQGDGQRLARYVRRCETSLAGRDLAQLQNHPLPFPDAARIE